MVVLADNPTITQYPYTYTDDLVGQERQVLLRQSISRTSNVVTNLDIKSNLISSYNRDILLLGLDSNQEFAQAKVSRESTIQDEILTKGYASSVIVGKTRSGDLINVFDYGIGRFIIDVGGISVGLYLLFKLI